MHGELQELNITEELVRKVAEEQFRSFDDFGELSDHAGYIQTDWKILARKDLDRFNDIVECLKKIKHRCEIELPGYWDVEEYYKE